MAIIEFKIIWAWAKVPPDMSQCTACEETIYSNTNILVIVANNIYTNTDVKLCDSCYQESKDIINEL